MLELVAALTPIFLLILLGSWFGRMGFPGESFWPMAEKITYYVFFPALLFNSLYKASFGELEAAPTALTVGLAMLLVSALVLANKKRLGLPDVSFSSFFQGSLRPNTYVGISAAFVLYGSQGLTLAALVIAVMVPLSNLFSVIVVSAHGRNEARGWIRTMAELARNPLILACLLGIAANMASVPLAFGTAELLAVLSQASLPLGLLSVGAGLRFIGLATDARPIALCSAVKLGLLPVFAVFLGRIAGLDGAMLCVAAIFAALPCGPAAYVLSRQLGGDSQLMAKIITAQTMAAFFTMPLLIGLLLP